MKREVELQRRLRALSSLEEAVRAMKSLSAHHFREARQAVEPGRTYRHGVEQILAWSGARLAAGDGPAGVLVIGGELGLCGSYNSQVVEAGARRRAELGSGPTFCVGRRASSLLARRNVEIARIYSGPTSVRGIPALLLRLAEDALGTYAQERLSSLEIVSSRFAGVGMASPTSVRLLPLEPEDHGQTRSARYVRADHFAATVIREFLYVTLYDLLLDALASEHGARLVATEGAEEWLEERTQRLRRHLAATRREASTQEMIEIAAGARARRGKW